MTFSSATIKAMISHLSSSRGLETFSDLDYENETLAANMTSLRIMQGQQHLCETFGFNVYNKDDTRFVFIGLDRRLQAIHSVTMDTEPTAPRDFRYVSIASDTITSSAFVKINDPQLYFRTILSIASKKDVKNSNFEEITLFNPNEINKPPPAATGPNTLAEMGFENANGDDLPCFTFVPLLLPIPPSFYIPVGHAITADLPPAPTGKKYLPAMTIWTKLMKYLATRNNSTSLEVVDNNLLFNATMIDIPNIANDWDTIKSKTIHLTVENIEDHLIPTLPSYDTIKQKLNSKLTNWFNHTEKTAEESAHLAAFMSPTATTHAAAATSTVGTHGLEVFSSAIRDSLDAFTNKKTSKEKSNERAVQQSQHKFSILLAVSGRDLTRPTVAVEHTIPANLRQEFTDILEEANAKRRHTEYKQLFMSTLDKAASEGKNYASLANWTKEQMDFALVAHIFDFAFHTEPLTSTQDSIASMNERFVAQSNLVDDNPKTHRIATTELFIDGEQATLEHVRHTVANLLVFLDTISHGASNSSLGQILLQISSLLGQSTTRAFFEKNTPKYPHLPHQVLLVIQDIFNTYVSMAADTSNLRQVADPAEYIQHTVHHNTENKSDKIYKGFINHIVSHALSHGFDIIAS
ncbi:hypothetical protein IV203_032966 [Nitzschia inconspicua]|uniref:Uncharacterized protein n=1 Tax=Nitzschia inconspicua TaxID=303405 RepID=A0A9K3KM16_9STRA|nr:hypothetical protein IV203_032966 [Nitzschia inconspicua]